MQLVVPFHLLVRTGYLIDITGYLVDTSGYLIAITGYVWLLLVIFRISWYFWFLVVVATLFHLGGHRMKRRRKTQNALKFIFFQILANQSSQCILAQIIIQQSVYISTVHVGIFLQLAVIFIRKIRSDDILEETVQSMAL